LGYVDDVGMRLRGVRTRLGLSLQDVERESGGVWKAAVVGSYERGDRTIAAARLCELADHYGVPVTDVLPAEDAPAMRGSHRGAVVIDLVRLEDVRTQFPGVARFAEAIRVQRGDFNNRTLSLRGEDARTLAIIEGLRVDSLLDALARVGVVRGGE
jgi:transcriptional regulator with XRE-family HTH domain